MDRIHKLFPYNLVSLKPWFTTSLENNNRNSRSFADSTSCDCIAGEIRCTWNHIDFWFTIHFVGLCSPHCLSNSLKDKLIGWQLSWLTNLLTSCIIIWLVTELSRKEVFDEGSFTYYVITFGQFYPLPSPKLHYHYNLKNLRPPPLAIN